MAMAEVGRLVIGVTADTSDAKKAIENELPKTGTTSGRKTSSMLTTALTAGAKVAGIGIAAVLGTALVKGFQRINAIDQAKNKLEGLGYAADEVQAIMDNALASVKGTAFGLDEAATLASQAVASGIKPGKDLTRQLTLIADTATIAGTSMGDLSDVFGDMYAQGNVTGETIARLRDRGIPALQILADSMGVSQAAMSEMVKNGEIDIDEFTKAFEGKFGGAALKGGETFMGGLKNVGAALSRFGAAVLQPVFDAAPDIMANITAAIDAMAPSATKLGEAFGDLLADIVPFIKQGLDVLGRNMPTIIDVFTRFVDILRGAIGVIADVVGWMVQQKDILIPIASVVAAMVIGFKAYQGVMVLIRGATMAWTAVQMALNVALSANPIGLVVAAIAGLVAIFVVLFKKNEGFRNFVLGVWEKIKEVAKVVWPYIKQAIETVFNAVKAVAEVVWPIVQKIITVVWKAVSWWVEHYVKAVWAVISTVFNAIKSFVEFVWPAVQKVIEVVWGAIKFYVTTYIHVIKTVIETVWNAIKATTEFVWNLIKDFIIDPIRAAWNRISEIVGHLVEWIGNRWDDIKRGTRIIWKAIKDHIIDPIRTAWNRVGEIVDNLRTWLSNTWTTIKDRASEAWNNVKSAIITPISELWGKFKEWLGLDENGDVKKGSGALGKLVSAFDAVVTAVKGAFGGITEAIKTPIIEAFKWINTNIIDRINEDVLSKFGGDLQIGHLPEKFARGGLATGPRSGYYAELHGTEFVMNERATRENLSLLHAMNSGQLGGGQLGAMIQRGAAPQTASAVQSAQSPGFNPIGWAKDLLLKGATHVVKGLTSKGMDWLQSMVGGTFGGDLALSAVSTFFDNMVKWVDKQVMSTGALGEALYQWMMAIKGDHGYYQECLATIHRALDDLAGRFGYTTGSLISSSPHPNAIIDSLGVDAFNTTKAPRGALVFWKGGTYGHIAVSTGIDSESINNYGGDTIDVVPNIGRDGYVGWLPPQRFVSKFDSGGWLQPGWTAAFNGTGKPEPIFTSDQFDALTKGPRVVNNWQVTATNEPTEQAMLTTWRRWEALQGV